jgi:iron complex transport system substrate-binding protein
MGRFSQIALSFLLLPLASGNPDGCVTEIEDKDYFEHKVVPVESANWSVSYHQTYKIVTNEAAGETYLLYQCGTEPPADQLEAGHTSIAAIPLEGVGLRYTTMIPFLELLGARMNIEAFFGFASYVSSPCLTELLDDSTVKEVTNPGNASLITNVPLDLPSFIGHYDSVAFSQTFRVSVTEEEGNLAAFEWIKFYSMFFNLEEVANEIFDGTKERYDCAEANAGLLSCEAETKPVVLWGAYSGYCGGWSVGNCPNYYCEFAEACSATLLNTTEGSIQNLELCGTAKYMTTEEFVAFGKDADYWIYTSSDFQNTVTTFPELEEFVSVQNLQVYDTSGGGSGAWFEQRLAEPGNSLFQLLLFETPSSHLIHSFLFRYCFAGLL